MEHVDQVLDSVARYFRLLSEPTRLRILHAVCQGEKSVNEIVEMTGATQTNVSRHLNMLHGAGSLARRKVGSNVYYRVADPVLIDICRSACVRIAGQIDDRQPLRDVFLDYYSI